MGEIIDPNTGKSVEKKYKEVDVPEKLKEKINDKHEKANQLVDSFVQNSFKRVALVEKEHELYQKIKNNKQALDNAINEAYKKLKLDKEKDYMWQYSVDGKFIGIPRKKSNETPKV